MSDKRLNELRKREEELQAELEDVAAEIREIEVSKAPFKAGDRIRKIRTGRVMEIEGVYPFISGFSYGGWCIRKDGSYGARCRFHWFEEVELVSPET